MEENELNMDEFANRFKSKDDDTFAANDIMVVGVGGGGGNAVNHMYKQGVEKVTFVVCNTDEVAVRASEVPNKVVIGNGRGAGNDPQKAKEFAERDIEKIEAIFHPDTRMAFITAGMGGGNAAADGIIEQKGDAVAGKDSEAQSGHIGDKPVRLNNSALSGVGHHIGSGNGTD